MEQVAAQRSSNREADKYLRGLCPYGCPTNHGGPRAAERLADEWREWPAVSRPSWADFVAMHGRARLADEYPEAPAAGG